MSEQRFSLGTQPEVIIEGLVGDLRIEGYEGEETILEGDVLANAETLENRLRVEGLVGDMALRLPFQAHITLEGVTGDVSVRDIQGKVQIEGLTGEVELSNVKHATIEGMAGGRSFAQDVAGAVRNGLRRSFPFSFGGRARAAKSPASNAATAAPGAPLEAERLAILRMLQEKKISAEEAEQLLQALGEG
uniref:YvlB/LiaX N-terminal domain-containing protein n=1 Tax=uncultured Chloroflexota bacterium TaxID=166587 RepID=H5SAK3_9CHLR|nr:hypothetical protein HGMM_F05B10C11 [uncultured Chloroflexota bacterium]